jgi:hypothetical protein
MIQIKLLAPALAAALLAACGGGGGGGGGGSVTIGGLAIDGYLSNAKVCLDLNLNFKCEAGEPSAITDDKGAYAFNYTGGDAAGLVVITETTKDTKDSDDNGLTFEAANRSPFVLAAPVPVGATNDVKITPLTTVVTTNSLTENVSGGRLALADVNAAAQALGETLGVDASKDLLKLDVSKDASLKPVAQLFSHILGEIQKSVTDNNSAKMKTAVLAASNTVTGLMQDGKVPASVTAALAKPPADRAAALKQIEAVNTVVASTSKTVNLGGSSVDPRQVLKDGLVIAEFDSGYNPVDPTKEGSIGDWKQGRVLKVEYLKYDADTMAFSQIERVLDNAWVKRANWGNDYSLTPKGTWVNTEGLPFEKGAISFTGNCFNFKENAELNHNQRVCLEEKDLSNLVISEVNAQYCNERGGVTPDQAVCKAAKFAAGSKGYEITFSIAGADSYQIWVANRASDRQYHFGTRLGNQPTATTIPAFVDGLVKLKGDTTFYLGINNNFSIRLKSYDSVTKRGVFSWLYNDDDNWSTPSVDAGESSFEVKDVSGVTVLVFKPSLKYHQVNPGDMVGRDFVFAAKDNQIWDGEVQYKDVRQQLSLNGFDWFGNKTMLESILSGLKFNQSSLPAFPFTASSDK